MVSSTVCKSHTSLRELKYTLFMHTQHRIHTFMCPCHNYVIGCCIVGGRCVPAFAYCLVILMTSRDCHKSLPLFLFIDPRIKGLIPKVCGAVLRSTRKCLNQSALKLQRTINETFILAQCPPSWQSEHHYDAAQAVPRYHPG